MKKLILLILLSCCLGKQSYCQDTTSVENYTKESFYKDMYDKYVSTTSFKPWSYEKWFSRQESDLSFQYYKLYVKGKDIPSDNVNKTINFSKIFVGASIATLITTTIYSHILANNPPEIANAENLKAYSKQLKNWNTAKDISLICFTISIPIFIEAESKKHQMELQLIKEGITKGGAQAGIKFTF